MELLLIWAFFGLIGIAIGKRKGMSTAVAFLGGMLLGPFSLLMIFVSPSKKKCPQCAEWVEKDAKLCRFCKTQLTAAMILFVISVAFADQGATTEDGKKVILRDDGTWAYADAPDEYKDATQIIKAKCKEDWPDDFNLRSVCEEAQQEAVVKLRSGRPKDISEAEYRTIHKKCTNDWPTDFNLRSVCEKAQFEAVRKLAS